MNELLLLKENFIDWTVNKIDSLTNLGIIGEAAERPAYQIILGQANKYLSPLAPDEFKIEFNQATDKIVAGEFDNAIDEGMDVIVVLVKRSEKLEPITKELIQALLKGVEAILIAIVQSKQEGEAIEETAE